MKQSLCIVLKAEARGCVRRSQWKLTLLYSEDSLLLWLCIFWEVQARRPTFIRTILVVWSFSNVTAEQADLTANSWGLDHQGGPDCWEHVSENFISKQSFMNSQSLKYIINHYKQLVKSDWVILTKFRSHLTPKCKEGENNNK